MIRTVELPVSLPSLRAVRATTTEVHTGMKDHFGVGRVEQGRSEWCGNGRVWRSAPGNILVKQPGDVHRGLANDGAVTFVVVTLPTDQVARVRSDGRSVLTPQLEFDDARAAPFHRLLDAVIAKADILTLEVATAEAVSALAAMRGAPPDYSRPVRRAKELLREQLDSAVSLDELAAYAELDKFHLCRAFRAQVGMPPHAYLTHLRVARAKQLLREGVRASDVAPMVGLYDQAQLTRHFRKLVGTTPARYGKKPELHQYRGVLVSR
jgi:AraC-like DNA-binding protein